MGVSMCVLCIHVYICVSSLCVSVFVHVQCVCLSLCVYVSLSMLICVHMYTVACIFI